MAMESFMIDEKVKGKSLNQEHCFKILRGFEWKVLTTRNLIFLEISFMFYDTVV